MPSVSPLHAKILRALSEVVGKTLPYDTLKAVRARLADVAPHFGLVNNVQVRAFCASF